MATSFLGVFEAAVQLLREGTKDAESCEDISLCNRVAALEKQLATLPGPPKATWKKVVQQQQVPLHVARAFCTAAQHSHKSPAASAALGVLMLLLRSASACGLTKEGAAVGPIAGSMRQQLQQAGLLPQLAGVMAALAADLRSETAALRGGGKSSEQLCSGVDRFLLALRVHGVPLLTGLTATVLHPHLRDLWGDREQSDPANAGDWLCDPSGHAEAALQLCTATLQHAGCVIELVLPAVHDKAPQRAARLLDDQTTRIMACRQLAAEMVHVVSRSLLPYLMRDKMLDDAAAALPEMASQAEQQQLRQLLQSPQLLPWELRQLLLSPHFLPWLLAWLALTAFWISSKHATGLRSVGAGSTTGAQTGSSSAGNTSSSSSSRAGVRGNAGPRNSTNLTPCQLQLLQQLGLSPQLAAMVECLPEPTMVVPQLISMLLSCSVYPDVLNARLAAGVEEEPFQGLPLDLPEQGVRQGPASAADQQQWRAAGEQQLWLLLPAALVPCASSLLQPAAAAAGKDPCAATMDRAGAQELIQQSATALSAASLLQTQLSSSGPVGSEDSSSARPLTAPHTVAGPAWMEEVLPAVLQLAKQLLPEQEPQASAAAAAAAADTSSRDSSTLSDAEMFQHIVVKTWADCAVATADLLSMLVEHSAAQHSAVQPLASLMPWHGSSSSTAAGGPTHDPASSAAGDPAAAAAAADPCTVPALAVQFVKVCSMLEAGLRAAPVSVQGGGGKSPSKTSSTVAQCVWRLLAPLRDSSSGHSNSNHRLPGPALALHVGLRGPEAHTAELRQLYSLLSTVHKLGSFLQAAAAAGGSGATGSPPTQWGQEAVNTCCLAAGQAAVWLLQHATARAVAAAEAAPPALQQAAEVQFLPSLVIFGRCCLTWAEQLQRQFSGGTLLLAPGTPAPQQEQGQAPHSAASVCIPGWPQQATASVATPAPCELEQLVGAVAAWVGGVTSPETREALAAAVGGADPDVCRRQLKALAAAQQALRQQGLSNATLSALAQQLQATGLLLSSVPVPLFCNNPACSNISGPAEVRLVSGRQCRCSGCRSARYCGRQCQKQAWPQHKPVCRALAAQLQAAGAGSSAGSTDSSSCE